MKKILSLISVAAVILAVALTANSCSKDQERAMALSGQWTGDFGMYYEIEYQDRHGDRKIATFDSYDTDIEFIPDHEYATHGYGYQVDFYEYGPRRKMSFKFYWDIDHGNIHLTYPGYPEYNAVIRDYHLDYDYFSGFFGESNSLFKLRKIADFYDWSPYYAYEWHYWDYPDWTWDDYYYDAKTRGTSINREDLPETYDPAKTRIIKIGNRFAEQK